MRKTKEQINCLNCDTSIPNPSGRRKFCDNSCLRSYNRKQLNSLRLTKKHYCANEQCGASFTATYKSTIYCSNKCRVQASNLKASAEESSMLRSKKRVLERFCENPACGKHLSNNIHAKYCSRSCKTTHHNLISAAIKQAALPKRICANSDCSCVLPKNLRKDAIYCSRACKTKVFNNPHLKHLIIDHGQVRSSKFS